MQTTASINLLKGRVNLLEEAVKWALTVGRLLIIIIEFVAFGTFVYRFSLDRTIVDLHDKINQEQAIVASLKDTEANYRNLQERLQAASKISKNGGNNVQIFQDIINSTPPEIKYDNFIITSGTINMQVEVSSVQAISPFLDSLRSYSKVSSATVNSLSSTQGSNAILMGVTVMLKNNSTGL